MSQELKLRIASTLVLAPLVLWITWLGGYAFVALWAIIAFLILSEYTNIISTILGNPLKALCYIALTGIILIYQFKSRDILFNGADYSVMFFIASFILLSIFGLASRHGIWAAGGLAYSALPFIAICELRGSDQQGLFYIIILFACVWGADTFAYFTGRTLQGPKLAPKISPNKTWSGFFGSLLGAVVLSSACMIYDNREILPNFLLIILIVAITSQLGDLVESSLKRKFGVKDSGNIIPGHGGILDRLDGFIPASVVLWLMVSMSNQALF